MTVLTISPQGAGQFSVAGQMTFAAISAQISTVCAFLTSAKQITIDLAQVTAADSAGLALLIEWKKIARNHKCQLVLKNIPEQLRMLAGLSGFDLSSHFTLQP
ncbi:Anti-sigma-factor antagonist [Crenothrix polyspora]|uniref:Anti-sigma-factor antagonist n=1 Tax=Crenothrix polyspora TaxID=360316 RepID=A0A1R4H5S0_9GAMM|nr:Anti-sigma-factor antagonist [Crenothrix polyspora]